MKKIIGSFLVLCTSGFSMASATNAGPLKDVGLRYTSISRDIEFDDGQTQEAEAQLFLINATLQASERVKFPISVGLGSFDVDYNELTFDGLPFTIVSRTGFSGDSSFAFAGGVEYRIYTPSDYNYAVDLLGQVLYFQTGSDDRSFTLPNLSGTFSQEGRWLEYELGARFIYEGSDKLRPYAGISISIVDGGIDGEETVGALSGSESKNFDNSDLFGASLGIDFKPSANIGIGLEVKLVSQTSFGVTIKYVF
jgi:hypothetical protein